MSSRTLATPSDKASGHYIRPVMMYAVLLGAGWLLLVIIGVAGVVM